MTSSIKLFWQIVDKWSSV